MLVIKYWNTKKSTGGYISMQHGFFEKFMTKFGYILYSLEGFLKGCSSYNYIGYIMGRPVIIWGMWRSMHGLGMPGKPD